MNPLLAKLQPYPFERLKQLFAPITPNPEFSAISLGIGEPRHATPQLVLDALSRGTSELSSYPLTAGLAALKEACAGWVQRRYGVRCLLYTSDAADERSSVDLGGRRIIK